MNKWIIILVIFLLGLYFSSTVTSSCLTEGYKNIKNNCPNILIQKGNEIYLHNSKLAKIPGVNPIKFDNLEDYVEFLNWQRSQNINCPVLFLQHSIDAQGKDVYNIRPSPLDLQGGLPPVLTYGSDSQALPLSLQNSQPQKPEFTKLIDAGRNDPPYNTNSYPGYDPLNLYEGKDTPLDKLFNEQEENALYSTNPMDTNWAGAVYTQTAIEAGMYGENK
jgi:hypothetical protein